MATSSSTEKKTYIGKKDSNAAYVQEGHARDNHNQSVGVVVISNPTPLQRHQQGNQRKEVVPKRQFTKINMSLAQALQHMLKA